MLHIPRSTPDASASIKPTREINGRKLSRRLKKGLSPTFRALLAHDLETGVCSLHRLTRRQACSLTGANGGYASTLARATTEEIEAVKRGKLLLSALHNKPKSDPFKVLARAMNEVNAELGGEDITVGDFVDRVLVKVGPNCLLDALDRITRPAVTANNNAATILTEAAE